MVRAFILVFLLLFFTSCSNSNELNNINQENLKLTAENTSLKEQIKENLKLAAENTSLKEQIRKLLETDQFYYQQAVDLLNSNKLDEALAKLNELKDKFPNSGMKADVDNLSKKINEKKQELYAQAKKKLDEITNSKNLDIEIIIQKLQEFIKANNADDLKQKAKTQLDQYLAEFETIKGAREAEKKTGVSIVSIESDWQWQGLSKKLLSPSLKIQFKNTSSSEIKSLQVKASFINSDKKEVFGQAITYVVGSTDTPLKPDFTKTAYLSSDVGYTNDTVAMNFPNLVADIYVNDILYKSAVPISKNYMGVDWGKK